MSWTADEMMTVAASRALRDDARCFVGIGLPSTAANLARRTHAPGLVLVYESGTIGAKPDRLPLSIGDGVLAETADAVVSVPEIFNYWLQPGRIDVGFLGAAQIDRFANINTTVIGPDYAHPAVRLPGASAPAAHERPTGFWRGTGDGLVFVWRDPVLRATCLLTMAVVALYLPVEGVVLPVYFTGQGAPARLGTVIMAMTEMGVPMGRINVTGRAQPGIRYDETQVFVR